MCVRTTTKKSNR